jgi:biopolymer transport protein ExbD
VLPRRHGEFVNGGALADFFQMNFLVMLAAAPLALLAAREGALKVQLPRAGAPAVAVQAEALTLTLSGERGRSLTAKGYAAAGDGARLGDALARLRLDPARTQLLVRADRDVAWRRVAEALDEARRAGLTNVAAITEAER